MSFPSPPSLPLSPPLSPSPPLYAPPLTNEMKETHTGDANFEVKSKVEIQPTYESSATVFPLQVFSPPPAVLSFAIINVTIANLAIISRANVQKRHLPQGSAREIE